MSNLGHYLSLIVEANASGWENSSIALQLAKRIQPSRPEQSDHRLTDQRTFKRVRSVVT